MKKRLTILCMLIAFSAFSFSLNPCKPAAAPAARLVKKNTHRCGIAPLADLALLPALNG